MAKKVSFGKDGMEAVLKGLDVCANAVAGTVGPKGRNVFISDPMTPKITNDGVTVANKISLEDPEQDAGAYVIRNVTAQTNDDCGDGTTTTAILTQAIIHEALARPENPMEVRESLNEATKGILETLKASATKITKEDVERVALISAEDPELAKTIAEIIGKLGEKAVINVEDAKTMTTDYEVVDGYEAPVGYMSPHFVTDRKTGKAILTDVPVLVVEKKISSIADIAPLFEQFKKGGVNECAIVCEDIDDSILGMLVLNKMQGRFNSVVIRAQGDVLKDIEGAVGATAISNASGITFQNVKLEHLGEARKIVCDASKTLILGNGEASHAHADVLEASLENEPNMYRKEKLKSRIAQLRGGVAVLRIAAHTDFEREYLKLKAEDAIKAVQAALEEGIVEGGGMTLWRLALQVPGDTIGNIILKKALTAPLKKIIENAGKDYVEIIRNMPADMGYNAKEGTYVNMVDVGIIDPVKVERCALANAVSAAGTFITTFAVVTDIPAHDKN